VTFTFDATARIVWLDDIVEGTARAGDLCTRHAENMVPPKGWVRDDRRARRVAALSAAPAITTSSVAVTDPSAPVAKRSPPGGATVDELLPHRVARRAARKRKKSDERWSDVPTLFDPPSDPPGIASDAAAGTEPPEPRAPAVTPTVAEIAATDAVATGPGPTGPTDQTDQTDLLDLTEAGAVGTDTTDRAGDMPGDIADDLDGDHPDEHRDDPPDATLVGAPAAWTPRYDVDDLGGLLDAKSPLLARAFRAAKASDTPSRHSNGEHATNGEDTESQDEDEDEIF
jgi:hypothetical protein